MSGGEEIRDVKVDHANVGYDSLYFGDAVFGRFHQLIIKNKAEFWQYRLGQWVSFQESCFGGFFVDEGFLPRAIKKRCYFLDLLHAKTSSLVALHRRRFSTAVTGSFARRSSVEHVLFIIDSFFELAVDDQQLFFDIFLQTPNIVVQFMRIALFLQPGDLFRQQIHSLNTKFIIIQFSIDIRYFLAKLMVRQILRQCLFQLLLL